MSDDSYSRNLLTIALSSKADGLRAGEAASLLAQQLRLSRLDATPWTAVVQHAACQLASGGGGTATFLLDRDRRLLTCRLETSAARAEPQETLIERFFGTSFLEWLERSATLSFRPLEPAAGLVVEQRLPGDLPLPDDSQVLGDLLRRQLDRSSPLDVAEQRNDQLLWLFERFGQMEREGETRQQRIEQLTLELEETNQGVLALYAELEDSAAKLRHLNETLEQRVAERTEEAERRAAQLRELTTELTQTEQRERRRLAQVLHDHLQQLLVAARMSLSSVRRRVQGQPVLETLRHIDDLLGESIEASRSLSVELSPPILYDVGLAAALQWLARQTREKHGLQLDTQLDEDAEPAGEDLRVLLFQVIRELVFNIVKHAGVDRAQLTMRRRGSDQVEIVVADEGAGFDVRRLESRDRSGTGYGLFSIRERLEPLGGALDVRSAPGQGTRMTIVAPLQQEVTPGPAGGSPSVPRTEAPATEAPVTSASLTSASMTADASRLKRDSERIRVVLADDYKSLRTSFARLLRQQADIEVVGEAADGRATVEMALATRPDVVIMDVSMPQLNGIEATRQILDKLPQVRVIGLSMHAENGMASAMLEAGAAVYLRKDRAAEELVAAVRECCPATRSY